MTKIISPENQDAITRELEGLGATANAESVIAEIDGLAVHFSERLAARRDGQLPRRYTIQTMVRQIEKVWAHKGQQRQAAWGKALRMGLDVGTVNLLQRPFHDAMNDLLCELEALSKNPGEFDHPDAKNTHPEKGRFTLRCLVIWLEQGGAIRFSVRDGVSDQQKKLEHLGPCGRFLRAAQADAYRSVGECPPGASGIRLMAMKKKSAAELIFDDICDARARVVVFGHDDDTFYNFDESDYDLVYDQDPPD